MPPSQGSPLNCVFENQPIVSGILAQLSRLIVENNLIADKKGSWKMEEGSYLYIHLNMFYRSVHINMKCTLRSFTLKQIV